MRFFWTSLMQFRQHSGQFFAQSPKTFAKRPQKVINSFKKAYFKKLPWTRRRPMFFGQGIELFHSDTKEKNYSNFFRNFSSQNVLLDNRIQVWNIWQKLFGSKCEKFFARSLKKYINSKKFNIFAKMFLKILNPKNWWFGMLNSTFFLNFMVLFFHECFRRQHLTGWEASERWIINAFLWGRSLSGPKIPKNHKKIRKPVTIQNYQFDFLHQYSNQQLCTCWRLISTFSVPLQSGRKQNMPKSLWIFTKHDIQSVFTWDITGSSRSFNVSISRSLLTENYEKLKVRCFFLSFSSVYSENEGTFVNFENMLILNVVFPPDFGLQYFLKGLNQKFFENDCSVEK